MSLSCMIIDDEPNAVGLLTVLIKETTTWNLVASCYNALEALSFLKNNTVDFVFLDINMPLLSGMELAELLPQNIKIVFTTAYTEHAAESYNYQTIDYLLKPITLKRFLAAIKKIEFYFQNPNQNIQNDNGNNSDEYFFVKSGKTLSKISLANILYFEGEKEYVRLVTPSEQLLIYKRLKDIECQLKLPFVRVHNSYIVNINQLHKIQDNHLFIADKQIPISDKFRDYFMTLIKERIF
ncbi:response regulator transcription factor [Pedobacter polaris]|uniref:Response regulator transcription factor n=1 Tax=Pedobacter polaris TaxID=2571273 RepID=A0A4U1CWH2_9SPHI|nr:LytTR family DNA-binding domain-containing protein [Pedobacter polaris]TKC10298.1 response regulator transcription factor [Pedobacter polaris]